MGRLLTCQFECCRGRNSIAVAVRHSAQVRHATTCMFSSPSIIIRCESSRYIATSPHFFSEKVSFIVRPLSSYRWAFSCALLDSQRDVPEPDSLISSRRGTRSVMRSSEMVRPTSPHGAARCQHQVAVMNTVPEVTILSGERRLQPPPVQCECSARSATASRYANSPCYGKEHQICDSYCYPVAAGSRTSTAAILLAGIGKYFRTRGLRVAKVVLRFSTHRELRSGRPPPVQAVAADFRQYAPGKYRLSGYSNRKVQYKSTRG